MKTIFSIIGAAVTVATILTQPSYAISPGDIVGDKEAEIVGDTQCKNDKYKICTAGVTYGSGCTKSDCYSCAGTVEPVISGNCTNKQAVHTFDVTCPSNAYGSATCRCLTSYTYTCSRGCYGYATLSGDGCYVCPENATCAGGNGSTFVCNEGYEKNGDKCQKSCKGETIKHVVDSEDCETPNATLCDYDLVCDLCGNNCYHSNERVFECIDEHYYTTTDNTQCLKCPDNGIVDWDVCCGITTCYIPRNSMTGSDETGNFKYINDKCHYQE